VTESPRHVAIIMDGNRRWAKKNNLSIKRGHEEGLKTFKEVVKQAIKEKIDILTFYAFSTENWGRPQKQVIDLIALMSNFIKNEADELHQNNIKLKILGDVSPFPKRLQQSIQNAVEKTKNNTTIILNVALNYGGRNEIIRAVNKLINEKKPVTEDSISQVLDTNNLPDPDLIIRTGGAQRLSNFLIWQSSYSEFYFTGILWPDYSADEFLKTLDEFADRERRFGK